MNNDDMRYTSYRFFIRIPFPAKSKASKKTDDAQEREVVHRL